MPTFSKTLFAFLFLFPVALFAQDRISLNLDSMSVSLNNQLFYSAPLHTQLAENVHEKYTLFENADMRIQVTYRIHGERSRRSSVKAASLVLLAEYVCEYHGKKDKRSSEQIIYIGNDRSASMKETFTFSGGLHPAQIQLKYLLNLGN